MTERAFEPDEIYDVRLTGPVEIGRFKFRPLRSIEMKGRLVAQIVEKYGEAILEP